jgi:hypothetical protein
MLVIERILMRTVGFNLYVNSSADTMIAVRVDL